VQSLVVASQTSSDQLLEVSFLVPLPNYIIIWCFVLVFYAFVCKTLVTIKVMLIHFKYIVLQHCTFEGWQLIDAEK